jgi:hypothetical protein
MTEIEVPVEALINTTSPAATHKALPATHTPTTMTPRSSAFRRTNANATLSKVDADADSVSLHASVLSRNTAKRSVTPSHRDQSLNLGVRLSSSASLVRSELKRHDIPSSPRAI